jgi:hypothetical protein
MAHDHDHTHGDANTYFLDQIFTIAACGALAAATIARYFMKGGLYFIVDRYHLLVLTGGVLLLAMILIRAIAVWTSVAEPVAQPIHDHDHDHDHGHHHHHHEGHTHTHSHEEGIATSPAVGGGPGITTAPANPLAAPAVHAHGHHHHDHDHDHGWAPWRYVVLFLPVVLFFLNLPSKTYSGQAIHGQTDFVTGEVKDRGKDFEIGFKKLEEASRTQTSRNYYEGKTVRLVGVYLGDDDKRFTLQRYKMSCCAADAIPLNAVIMVDPKSPAKLNYFQLNNKWMEVTGRVHFLRLRGKDQYVTALVLYPQGTDEKTANASLKELVREVPQPDNPLLN